MTPGKPVEGPLTTGWFFVAADAHNINEQVTRIDPNLRLVFAPEHSEGAQRLGVAEWFPVSKMARVDADSLEDAMELPLHAAGGLWVIGLRPTGELGEPLCGEPDERVLTYTRRRVNARRGPFNARRWFEYQRAMIERAEEKQRREMREAVEEWAAIQHHDAYRARGDRSPRIWVPDGARVV